MPTQCLPSTLLLCVLLLLLQVQGGHREERKPKKMLNSLDPRLSQEINVCVNRPRYHMCHRFCESHQDCQVNNIYCSAFCGNICRMLQ